MKTKGIQATRYKGNKC